MTGKLGSSAGPAMVSTSRCAQLADEFARSAESNLQTAVDLAAIGRDWCSVYWHAGFAVENILKALRVRRDGLEEWPEADRSAKWHDITYVAARAGLTEQLKHKRKNKTFAAYWLTVKDWDQSRRYPGNTVTKSEAADLLKAIRNPTNGVMKCLRQFYQNT